jgi:hypothetical protein
MAGTLGEVLVGMKEGMAALGLESSSIKVPVSLVEGKRPATFTPQSSRNRLHFLQNMCSVPRDGSGQGLSAPEGILVIPGIDGHFNDGSQRIINYLFNGKWYAFGLSVHLASKRLNLFCRSLLLAVAPLSMPSSPMKSKRT